MQIIDNVLHVTAHGAEVTVALPAVAVTSKVKVWAVPTAYRADGVFVSVTAPGEAEAIPACDMALCEYLGEAELQPAPDAVLSAAKARKLDEINRACDAQVAAYAAGYPSEEVASWDQQVKEAESLAANPSAPAPLLTAIAAARGVTVDHLAGLVRAKASAYAVAIGAIIGKRQALEDQLKAAASIDAINAIHW